MKTKPICKARQHSDQMQCGQCGLTWDVNDPEPPTCQPMAAGRAALSEIREALVPKPEDAAKLLSYPEMPLAWLPVAGTKPGMYRVDWPTEPDWGFVLIGGVPGHQGKARCYTFFRHTGQPATEIVVEEIMGARNVSRRDFYGEATGWVVVA